MVWGMKEFFSLLFLHRGRHNLWLVWLFGLLWLTELATECRGWLTLFLMSSSLSKVLGPSSSWIPCWLSWAANPAWRGLPWWRSLPLTPRRTTACWQPQTNRTATVAFCRCWWLSVSSRNIVLWTYLYLLYLFFLSSLLSCHSQRYFRSVRPPPPLF